MIFNRGKKEKAVNKSSHWNKPKDLRKFKKCLEIRQAIIDKFLLGNDDRAHWNWTPPEGNGKIARENNYKWLGKVRNGPEQLLIEVTGEPRMKLEIGGIAATEKLLISAFLEEKLDIKDKKGFERQQQEKENTMKTEQTVTPSHQHIVSTQLEATPQAVASQNNGTRIKSSEQTRTEIIEAIKLIVEDDKNTIDSGDWLYVSNINQRILSIMFSDFEQFSLKAKAATNCALRSQLNLLVKRGLLEIEREPRAQGAKIRLPKVNQQDAVREVELDTDDPALDLSNQAEEHLSVSIQEEPAAEPQTLSAAEQAVAVLLRLSFGDVIVLKSMTETNVTLRRLFQFLAE